MSATDIIEMIERRVAMHAKMAAEYDRKRIWDAADRSSARSKEAAEIIECIRATLPEQSGGERG